jgi:hypothetical protein
VNIVGWNEVGRFTWAASMLGRRIFTFSTTDLAICTHYTKILREVFPLSTKRRYLGLQIADSLQ